MLGRLEKTQVALIYSGNLMEMYICLATLLGILSKTCAIADNQSHCQTENQQIPHETKCHLYYRCIYGRKVLKICPPNKLFNADIANCDDNYNVLCGPLEIDLQEGDDRDDINWEEEDLDSLSENTVATYEDAVFATPPAECPSTTDPYEDARLLPHESKCNAYYKCFEGRKFEMYCPGVMHFDSRILVCDWPANVKCVEKVEMTSSTEQDSTLSAVCPESECQDSTIYLAHPLDVRKYVRCENGKEVAEECPSGLVFDPALHTCNYPS